jgi:protein-export membrane protein SecD
VFFVVFVLILALTYTAFFGIENYYGDTRQVYVKGANDIRWGIDIRGGVEAVFSPAKSDAEITSEDMEAAKTLIESRLVNKNITDYEVYCDVDNNQVIVRFPWEADESDFDAVQTVKDLGASTIVQFRKGTSQDGEIVLEGAQDIASAGTGYDPEKNQNLITLKFTDSGKAKFSTATANMVGEYISIWLKTTTSELDENGEPKVEYACIQQAQVKEAIPQGEATISGAMTSEYVVETARKINSGKLPFAMTSDNSKIQIISPTLGADALNVMLIAGSIAFALVCVLMIARYRLNGVVTSIALLGQLAGSIACISGYFSGVDSFTLTIPGIAGIILSIGVGVDCNVIAAERIRDEFEKGKTIDGAIDSGFKNSLSAIIDGNVTIIIVSIVLMGAFGSPDSMLTKVFSPIMSLMGTSITGSIYSFGYTLLVGTIFNLIMGVVASKLMVKSLSRMKIFRKAALYGGKNNA